MSEFFRRIERKHMFVHVHVLWPAVAAAVNRDDNNRQKTTLWGNVPRARWSSQSQKASARELFSAATSGVGETLTRRFDLIEKALLERGVAPVWANVAAELSWNLATGGSDGMVLVAKGFADRVAEAIIRGEEVLKDEHARTLDVDAEPGDDASVEARALFDAQVARKESVVAKLKDKPTKRQHDAGIKNVVDALMECDGSIDIAFHGRMMSMHPRFNVDAAAQVSHAIGVDGWRESNIDFFTAHDREEDRDYTATVAMMGHRPNGTALFYRYAVIDTVQAASNLGVAESEVLEYVAPWVGAFCDAVPVSYASSTAPWEPPIFAGVEVSPRDKAKLVSFCHAPISGGRQYVSAVEKLLGWHDTVQSYQATGTLNWWSSLDNDGVYEHATRFTSWRDVIDATVTDLTARVADA